MKAPRYTISMLCFNHLEVTKRCIESIFEHTGQEAELIITNNASHDGTKEYLDSLKERNLHSLTIIHNKVNEGFQGPNKHALTLAKGEYFILLNNDMEVCANWLKDLSAPFNDNPKLAITGLSKDVCCEINDDFIGTWGKKVEYIEGSCLMIPTALARKHGLFSPYLEFIYWEDTDLSLRMRELGYEIKTVPVKISHRHHSVTTRSMNLREVMLKNQKAMKERWDFYIRRRDLKRRILIRRLGARGDVLLITPVLRALRNKYPQADIQVVTKHPEMLRDFDGVKIATSKRSYFDYFFDLDKSYEKRPEVHIVKAYADVCGVTLPPNWNMELFPTEDEKEWAFRKTRGRKRIALIHGGVTTWPGKNWPLERMEIVVRNLKQMGYFTIAIGAKDSPDCGCDDSIAGQGTPQALYALGKFASLFIGLDSMPQHVMSAANVPSVVLFGPTNPNCIVRPTPRIIPVFGDVRQVPCIGEHGRRTIPITQAPCGGECIRAITVQQVLNAVQRIESRSGK